MESERVMAFNASDPAALAKAITSGDRAALSRAITLVESTRADHRAKAAALLDRLIHETGRAIRIGLSGVPGAGKSTLLDAFGMMLAEKGHKVAILAVDPSSVRTGGSILGDKTRMQRLATEPNAFIRPSPTSGTLGGVAGKTRETMLLCEAAGYDVVIVETVGVGQSEVTVSEMVDLVVLLTIAGGGDELQGIKKGILEVADIVVVNKADGDNLKRARRAAAELRAALDIMTPKSAAWKPPVACVSAMEGTGLAELWQTIVEFRTTQDKTGAFAEKRAGQRVRWLERAVDEELRRRVLGTREAKTALSDAESLVRAGDRSPSAMARELLDKLGLTESGLPPPA